MFAKNIMVIMQLMSISISNTYFLLKEINIRGFFTAINDIRLFLYLTSMCFLNVFIIYKVMKYSKICIKYNAYFKKAVFHICENIKSCISQP